MQEGDEWKMQTDQKNNTGKKTREEKIKEIREKLDWYTFKASEEEFDEEEVEWLVQRLYKLEGIPMTPGQEPGSDFAQFKEYLMEKRAYSIQRGAAAGGEAASESGADGLSEKAAVEIDGRKGAKQKKTARWRVPTVAAVAVLAVAVLAGGTMVVANAQKEGGIFNLIRKDERGEKWVILPQDGDLALVDGTIENYSNMEDISEEYQEDIIDVEAMETLADYELKEVKVINHSFYIEIFYILSNANEELQIADFVYKNEETIVKEEVFDQDTYQGTEEVEGISIDIFSKADPDDGLDIAVGFWADNHQCRIEGKGDLEQLKEIAVEYTGMVEQKK